MASSGNWEGSREMVSSTKQAYEESILLHLDQALELGTELTADMYHFKDYLGAHTDTLHVIKDTTKAFHGQSEKIRSTITTSPTTYAAMKQLYASMQDAKSHLALAKTKKKHTSIAKEKFVLSFKAVSLEMRMDLQALLTAVTLEFLSQGPKAPREKDYEYQMGLTYLHGLHGLPRNHSLAFGEFLRAAEKGNSDAMVALAKCHLSAQGCDKDEQQGLEWLANAANSADCAHGKNELAMLIITNIREQNPTAVKDFCDKMDDDSESESRKGVSFQDGDGEDGEGECKASEPEEHYDVGDAIKLLLSSAGGEKGCADAMCNLGWCFEEAGDLRQAASWYEKASEAHCVRGSFSLGQLYLKGKAQVAGGQAGDTRLKAFALLSTAAKGGHAEAHNGLGTCFELGIGVRASPEQAVVSYRASAQGGCKMGMYHLGYLLVQNAIEMRAQVGRMAFTSKSASLSSSSPTAAVLSEELLRSAQEALKEGVHWLRAAAENGVKDAPFQLGRLYEQAIGVPEDSQAALANYKSAAELGHAKSALYAGNLLYSGAMSCNMYSIGEAAAYYRQAALAGLPEAMNSYAILLEDGRAGLSKEPREAAAWFLQACVEAQLHRAFVNLALLQSHTPLKAFRAVTGELVSLMEVRGFLLEYFESDQYTGVDGDEEDVREQLLDLVHALDENGATLPFEEEVVALEPGVSPDSRSGPAQHSKQESPHSSSRGGSERSEEDSGDSEEEVVSIDVRRIPVSGGSLGSRSVQSAVSKGTYSQEASRSPHTFVQRKSAPRPSPGPKPAPEPELKAEPGPVPVPRPGPLKPARVSGKMYVTDGPVFPPTYVPKAIMQSAPSGADKPAPSTSEHDTYSVHSAGEATPAPLLLPSLSVTRKESIRKKMQPEVDRVLPVQEGADEGKGAEGAEGEAEEETEEAGEDKKLSKRRSTISRITRAISAFAGEASGSRSSSRSRSTFNSPIPSPQMGVLSQSVDSLPKRPSVSDVGCGLWSKLSAQEQDVTPLPTLVLAPAAVPFPAPTPVPTPAPAPAVTPALAEEVSRPTPGSRQKNKSDTPQETSEEQEDSNNESGGGFVSELSFSSRDVR